MLYKSLPESEVHPQCGGCGGQSGQSGQWDLRGRPEGRVWFIRGTSAWLRASFFAATS